jgi:hypothetical protein
MKTAGGGKLGASTGRGGKILKGLKAMMPASSDSSSNCPKASVNSGATRKNYAPSPSSLGPRRA